VIFGIVSFSASLFSVAASKTTGRNGIKMAFLAFEWYAWFLCTQEINDFTNVSYRLTPCRACLDFSHLLCVDPAVELGCSITKPA